MNKSDYFGGSWASRRSEGVTEVDALAQAASGTEDLFIFAFEDFDFILCECLEILALRTFG